MADIGILTTTLDAFNNTVSAGYGHILPDVLWLLKTLIAIETVFMGILLMAGKSDWAELLFKKVISVCFIYFLIIQAPTLYHAYRDTMISIGLAVGGGSFTVADLGNPSAIVGAGLTISEPIWTYINTELSWRQTGQIITLSWAGIFIILSYFVMAVQLLLAHLEFLIVVIVSLIFLPFAVSNSTNWIAQGFFKAFVGQGIRMLVLCVILSIGVPLVNALIIPVQPTLSSCFGVLLGAMCVAFLAWQVPSMAGGMVYGQPRLSAGVAAGSAVAAGYAAMRGGAAAKQSVNQAARGGGAAVRGAGAAHSVYAGGTRLNNMASNAASGKNASAFSNFKVGSKEVASAGSGALKQRFKSALGK